jgi:hypothetical protein
MTQSELADFSVMCMDDEDSLEQLNQHKLILRAEASEEGAV